MSSALPYPRQVGDSIVTVVADGGTSLILAPLTECLDDGCLSCLPTVDVTLIDPDRIVTYRRRPTVEGEFAELAELFSGLAGLGDGRLPRQFVSDYLGLTITVLDSDGIDAVLDISCLTDLIHPAASRDVFRVVASVADLTEAARAAKNIEQSLFSAARTDRLD